MIKLVEQFGTKYFAAHWVSDVQKFLKTVDAVDIADARLCRSVMEYVLLAASNGVEVHDTLDPEREADFEEGRRRRALTEKYGTPKLLQLPTTSIDVLPSIKALQPDVLYAFNDGERVAVQAYVFLLQAARPEVLVDLGSSVGNILAFVYSNLFPSKHKWKEFYILRAHTFVVKHAPDDGYSSFISDNIVVPTDFGNACLFKLPEWQACIERAARILDKSFQSKELRLRDFL